MPNSDPCQIITPLVLVGLGLGVGEGLGLGVGLGLGNHIAISRRGVIIWQGVENGHNTGPAFAEAEQWLRSWESQMDKQLHKHIVCISILFTNIIMSSMSAELVQSALGKKRERG